MPLDLSELFKAYNRFKDAYADLVAYIQDKPLEILVEVENAFSHLMVALESPEAEEARVNLSKAVSHLQRATLDCYKLLWVRLGEDLESLLRDQKKRLALSVKEQEFWSKWEKFKEKSREARKLEIDNVGVNPLASIEAYQEACDIAWSILERVDEAKYSEVKKFALKSKIWELVVSGLIGALLSYFLCKLF